MTRDLFSSLTRRFARRLPLFIYAASWTLLLTFTVAVASLAPELAFVSAISPTSTFTRRCEPAVDGAVRVPLDMPSEIFCFPANMYGRSQMDLVVPPLFAAVVVAGSAFVVRAMGLWETDEAH